MKKKIKTSDKEIQELANKIVEEQLAQKIQEKVNEAYEIVKSQIKIFQIAWVVSAVNDSGDDYGPWVFEKKPTDKQLERFLRDECPEDFLDDANNANGPGNWGSYLHVKGPKKVKVIR